MDWKKWNADVGFDRGCLVEANNSEKNFQLQGIDEADRRVVTGLKSLLKQYNKIVASNSQYGVVYPKGYKAKLNAVIKAMKLVEAMHAEMEKQ